MITINGFRLVYVLIPVLYDGLKLKAEICSTFYTLIVSILPKIVLIFDLVIKLPNKT